MPDIRTSNKVLTGYLGTKRPFGSRDWDGKDSVERDTRTPCPN